MHRLLFAVVCHLHTLMILYIVIFIGCLSFYVAPDRLNVYNCFSQIAHVRAVLQDQEIGKLLLIALYTRKITAFRFALDVPMAHTVF